MFVKPFDGKLGFGFYLFSLHLDACDLTVAFLFQRRLDVVQMLFNSFLDQFDVIVVDRFLFICDQHVDGLEADRRAYGLVEFFAEGFFQTLAFANHGIDLICDFLFIGLLNFTLLLFKRLEFRLTIGFDIRDALLIGVGASLFVLCDFVFDAFYGALFRIIVHLGNDVLREIEHAIQITSGYVQQEAKVGGNTPRIPHVCDGGSQGDVPHALSTHGGTCDFYAALLAGNSLEANILILTAVALPIPLWSKDRFAKQTILLRPQPAVIDRFRF